MSAAVITKGIGVSENGAQTQRRATLGQTSEETSVYLLPIVCTASYSRLYLLQPEMKIEGVIQGTGHTPEGWQS